MDSKTERDVKRERGQGHKKKTLSTKPKQVCKQSVLLLLYNEKRDIRMFFAKSLVNTRHMFLFPPSLFLLLLLL